MIRSNFYVAKIDALRFAIDQTGTSVSKIAAAGHLSRETIRKVSNGERITRAKAHGLLNGLRLCGVETTFEVLFEDASHSSSEGHSEDDINADDNHSSSAQNPYRRRPRPPLPIEAGIQRFRIEVGSDLGVIPQYIIGVFSAEAGLDPENIKVVKINPDYSIVDLPKPMPKEIFNDLAKTRIRNVELNMSRVPIDSDDAKLSANPKRMPRPPRKKIGKSQRATSSGRQRASIVRTADLKAENMENEIETDLADG